MLFFVNFRSFCQILFEFCSLHRKLVDRWMVLLHGIRIYRPVASLLNVP